MSVRFGCQLCFGQRSSLFLIQAREAVPHVPEFGERRPTSTESELQLPVALQRLLLKGADAALDEAGRWIPTPTGPWRNNPRTQWTGRSTRGPTTSGSTPPAGASFPGECCTMPRPPPSASML